MKTLYTVLVMCVLVSAVYAGPKKVVNQGTTFKNKYALDNLIAGIKSENHGVQKTCIYYAGLYKVEETVDYLIEVIKKSKEEDIQKLVVLSLYEIKDEHGIEFLKNYSSKCPNKDVKRISILAYRDYKSNK